MRPTNNQFSIPAFSSPLSRPQENRSARFHSHRHLNPLLTIIRALAIFIILLTAHFTASGQTIVRDIFDRSLNRHGIVLVDWDGYMANPLIKLYIYPPEDADLPGTAKLSVQRRPSLFRQTEHSQLKRPQQNHHTRRPQQWRSRGTLDFPRS